MSKINVAIEDRSYEIEVDPYRLGDSELTVMVNGRPVQVIIPELDDPEQFEWIVVNDRPYEIVFDRDLRWIRSFSGQFKLSVRDLEAAVSRPASADGRIKAPIPGLVTRVLVSPGDTVEAGQPVLVLEAMKMENEIRAPRSGALSQLNVAPGQKVKLREVLAEIT